MAALARFDYFFDLPGELREQILSYLLVRQGGILAGCPGDWSENIAHKLGLPSRQLGFLWDSSDRRNRLLDDWVSSSDESDESGEDSEDDEDDEDDGSFRRRRRSKWPLNYFLVSQTFYREVTAVYFRHNMFYLLATGRKQTAGGGLAPHHRGKRPGHRKTYHEQMQYARHQRARTEAGAVLFPGMCEKLLGEAQYQDSRRRIRKVVVYVRALRGLLVEDLFKPLGDMILAGGLKHLEIRVWWFQTKGPGMLSSVPMQAMYRVLKDPDLENARLRVIERHHERAWCPFHADPSTSCGLGQTMRHLGEPLELYGLKWIDIDLDKLVKQHGDVGEALSILKVGD